jgi:PST family polysaccharide transporter
MNSEFAITQLGKLALRSAGLVFFIDLLQKISGPLLAIIFAWFLTPEEFGILGIANLVLAFAFVFQQGSVSDAIIQYREKDDFVHSSFWASIVLGAVLYIVVWFFAPVVSRVFYEPNSAIVIRVLSLQLVISSFGMVPVALLKRNFEFGKVFVSQFYAALMPVVVSIPLILYGFGYWAVVVGILSSNLLYVSLIWLKARYVPKLVFGRQHALGLLRFGGFVILESLFGWFFVYFDNALVGAVLGTSALGIYSLAFNLTNSAIGLPVGALAGVSLATFSKLQDDKDALRNMYMEGTRLIALYAIPASIGLSLLSQPLEQVLFSDAWAGIGSLMAVLALYAGFAHIWILNSQIFKALGKPYIMLQIYAPLLLLVIPAFLISVEYGVMVFAITRSFVVIVFGGLLHTAYAAKILGLKWSYVWVCCRLPLLASAFLAICLLALNQISWEKNLEISLLLRILLGILSYVVGLLILDRRSIGNFFRRIKTT